MKKQVFVIFLTFIISVVLISNKPSDNQKTKFVHNTKEKSVEKLSKNQLLFNEINLRGKLNFSVFEIAMNGYENLKQSLYNSDIITIIDFSLPSTEKRMYVIDLKNKKLLFHTIVSHGKNSGDVYATMFSNRHGSHQSSLGFYVTENTYQGRNGYSLVINGLEKNINDQAKPRAVVIHGANYCNENVIRNTGRLGRSYGCPALPRELNTPIINTIKEGSMLYIYADNQEYFASSKIFKNIERTMLAQQEDNIEDVKSFGTMR